jgi:hypothetical protein
MVPISNAANSSTNALFVRNDFSLSTPHHSSISWNGPNGMSDMEHVAIKGMERLGKAT